MLQPPLSLVFLFSGILFFQQVIQVVCQRLADLIRNLSGVLFIDRCACGCSRCSIRTISGWFCVAMSNAEFPTRPLLGWCCVPMGAAAFTNHPFIRLSIGWCYVPMRDVAFTKDHPRVGRSAVFACICQSDTCVGTLHVTLRRAPLRRHEHRRGTLRVRSDALGVVVVHGKVLLGRSYIQTRCLQVGWWLCVGMKIGLRLAVFNPLTIAKPLRLPTCLARFSQAPPVV